jgi:hypothetical protein
MTELVMCRRGPGRQAGAARPDLVNAAMLPSAQPLKHLRSRRSRSRPRAHAPPGRNSNAATCQAAGQPKAEVTLFNRQHATVYQHWNMPVDVRVANSAIIRQ